MDILRPNVVWIRGRCYRLYGQTLGPVESDYIGYGDDDEAFMDTGRSGDISDEDYEIVEANTGRMKTAFHIPRSLHNVLVGKKGATKMRIEKETKTLIRIPNRGLDQDIVISGATKECVAQARRRLEIIALTARQKQQFTHFISFPVNSDDIKSGFLKFKEEVLQECGGRGIGKDIFQDPNKLHLTIGTLVLLDDHDRKKAAHALQSCHEDLIQPLLHGRPLRLSVQGVEYMNDDPAEVDVLYGKVRDLNDEPVLQELADGLMKCFEKTGLMPKQFDCVKLHVTLMNSLFRRDNDSEALKDENVKRARESFDATSILKKFQDYFFGEIVLKRIDLSRRYSTAADGYYDATASIEL